VTDPLTGDVIGHQGIRAVAEVRVTRVLERSSEAVIESGGPVERGQRLERIRPAEAPSN
jgi:hypothetical protein